MERGCRKTKREKRGESEEQKERGILVSQDPKLSWWYVLYVVCVAVREHERERERGETSYNIAVTSRRKRERNKQRSGEDEMKRNERP